MRFQYVDRIHSYEVGKSIRGIKNCTRNEPFYYWLPSGVRVLSPAVVSEAMAQLGGWLKIISFDFKKRPVFLADEITTYHGIVQAGDVLDMHIEVVSFDEDVIVTKGTASVEGKVVIESKCTRGYMLPMEEFDDPAQVRRMFNHLYKPDFANVSRVPGSATKLKAIAGSGTFESLRFLDGLIEHEPYKKVTAFKNFANCEPYFADHFPRRPVTPGVMLLTFMGEVCQYVVKDDIYMPIRARALVPTAISNVRFRKFVEPGDQCTLKAVVKSGDCSKDNQDVVIAATIFANDNRVMQADMGFRTMFGVNSNALKDAFKFVG